ncbi:hypothetical protein KI688_011346 [Linnemannia hyalina]|uniref:Uncharacterized protein n=1 Tax=Linnemannia hyalina TaxID=64524 RepID=A0A9P7XUQ5_9FUNG|nr:hypothetical protein KI688_011346 [Linnemannia hyalina]
MHRHRDNNHQQLQQLQNRRTLTNTPATRHHPHVPNINNIQENELADGRNFIQVMLTQIKEVPPEGDFRPQKVANFQKMEQQRQKAEEDKRKVALVQSAMKGVDTSP